MKFNTKLSLSKETLRVLSETDGVQGGAISPKPLTNCCPNAATNNTYYVGDNACVVCSKTLWEE